MENNNNARCTAGARKLKQMRILFLYMHRAFLWFPQLSNGFPGITNFRSIRELRQGISTSRTLRKLENTSKCVYVSCTCIVHFNGFPWCSNGFGCISNVLAIRITSTENEEKSTFTGARKHKQMRVLFLYVHRAFSRFSTVLHWMRRYFEFSSD